MIHRLLIYVALLLAATSCSNDGDVPFLDDLDLRDSIPERVFYFDFQYESLYEGMVVDQGRTSFPTPFSKTSYSSFDATSESKTEDGLRFVQSTLEQGLHAIEDSVDAAGDPVWQDRFELSLKLNIAVEGDVAFGSNFLKEQLIEFLVIGKTFGNDPDSLGHITLTGSWSEVLASQSSGGTYFINRVEDRLPELIDYGVTITDVVDYTDLSRDGTVIKEALMVTAEVEGLVQVSSSVGPQGQSIDQLNILEGELVFLVDYQ